VGTAGAGAGEDTPVLDGWPLPFQNATRRFLPTGRVLRAAAHWPAARDGFHRELTPAALLLTDRELVLLSKERAWTRGPGSAKYGHIVTNFPLGRLAGFDLHEHRRLCSLDLRMHAAHGGEGIHVLFPAGQEQGVAHLLGSLPGAP